MTIGNVIATNRKKMGLTQDGLAQQLGVTNQAVSKWESDQSCPDITLLPLIADIFGITIDELFGRERPAAEPAEPAPAQIVEVTNLPWPDDETLRVVVYKGHTYLASCPEQKKITLEYDGPALNVDCAVNLSCNEVCGNVSAGGDVSCDAVNGSVDAGGTVSCNEVMGNVSAGGDVSCDAVEGNVNAGGSVSCDSVEGNVSAGMDVTCDDVEGNIFCGRDVTCDEVSGSITAGGTVNTDGEGHSNFRFSMGGKGKKNHRIHITVDGDDVDGDTAEDGLEDLEDLDDTIEDTIESKIEKFVNNIIRKSTDFRF